MQSQIEKQRDLNEAVKNARLDPTEDNIRDLITVSVRCFRQGSGLPWSSIDEALKISRE